MPHVHIPDLPRIEQRSPRGKFHSHLQNISLALGGIANTGVAMGGHPFDVQIRRIPAGASVCPFHLHVAQWEFFVVQLGTGTVRSGTESRPIGPGDFFIQPPGVPHQLTASDGSDLSVLIIADNPPVDVCYYPESDKWAMRPGKVFRTSGCDYFDGEEEPVIGAPPRPPPASPPSIPIAPFAERLRNVNDVPWETWISPKQRFRNICKGLSVAVGAKPRVPVGLGGHPFDVELVKVPPGAIACPFHMHAAQWEMFMIISGTAVIRTETGNTTASAGDVWLHPPRTAHQTSNPSNQDDLEYLLIADNPPTDYWFYPDSQKWGLPNPRMFFRPEPLDYFDGEE